MESTETLHHTLHLLKENYFIDEVEMSHTIGKDYWLGRTDSNQRMWLSDTWTRAKELAEEKIG